MSLLDLGDVDKTLLPWGGSHTGDGEVSAHTLRRPFFLEAPGSRVAVLLVHGFSGTPFEMRPLGEALFRRGYTVYAPRLFGHGETSAALGSSTHADWVRTVDEAFDALRARASTIYVCGLSLGGLLTLELASRRGPEQIAGITSLAAPLWFSRAAELITTLTRRLGRRPGLTIPKLSGSDIADPVMKQRNNLAQGTVGLPIPAVISLRDFADQVRALLPRVKVPALLVHAPQDHTAPYDCMAVLAKELGSPRVETMDAPRSFHVLPLDYDRDAIAEAVARHIDATTRSA